jgi:hypothetical protein
MALYSKKKIAFLNVDLILTHELIRAKSSIQLFLPSLRFLLVFKPKIDDHAANLMNFIGHPLTVSLYRRPEGRHDQCIQNVKFLNV